MYNVRTPDESGKILNFYMQKMDFFTVCGQFVVKIIAGGLGLTPGHFFT